MGGSGEWGPKAVGHQTSVEEGRRKPGPEATGGRHKAGQRLIMEDRHQESSSLTLYPSHCLAHCPPLPALLCASLLPPPLPIPHYLLHY